MEDDYTPGDSPNDYITETRSQPMLLKLGDQYVMGCVHVQANHMTSQFTQHHEISDPSPDEKFVFKYLLENGEAPTFISGGVSPEYMTRNYRNV